MSSVPTVYFIDDSATMREVIKIAFRRENINVVAHQDAATALREIEQAKPEIVITDVIMPEKDGYEVCQFIKNHPSLSKTPVILMSGVVNRAVAEKAFAVKADELLRKPFQPQDLITRVKHLLKQENGHPAPTPASAVSAAAALTSIFSTASAPQQPRPGTLGAPGALVRGSFAGANVDIPTPPQRVAPQPGPVPPAAAAHAAHPPVASAPPAAAAMQSAPAQVRPQLHPQQHPPANGDAAKLKLEILRLEGLVKKLQSELAAEREYARGLEEQVRAFQKEE